MITINRKTFVVREVDAETGYGAVLGKAKNLEEACDMAERIMENEEVEYGIHFVKK